jgi:hypothetical protein
MPNDNSLPTLTAVSKFFEMNDDLDAIEATNRRVLFEFLRTKPTLSTDEVDNLWAIADLLADLCKERRQLK